MLRLSAGLIASAPASSCSSPVRVGPSVGSRSVAARPCPSAMSCSGHPSVAANISPPLLAGGMGKKPCPSLLGSYSYSSHEQGTAQRPKAAHGTRKRCRAFGSAYPVPGGNEPFSTALASTRWLYRQLVLPASTSLRGTVPRQPRQPCRQRRRRTRQTPLAPPDAGGATVSRDWSGGCPCPWPRMHPGASSTLESARDGLTAALTAALTRACPGARGGRGLTPPGPA